MFSAHRGALALTLGVLALAACRKTDNPDANAATARDTSASARRDSMGATRDSLTDGDMAAMISMANTNDSAGGEIAKTRASSPAVRDFGAKMVREHGAANREAAALAQRLEAGHPAMQNKNIRDMHDHARDNMAALSRDSGQAFDRTYMDQEVDGHQNVLNKIDNDLIPHAQDADLKRLLTQARTMVNAHLQEAKRIKDALH